MCVCEGVYDQLDYTIKSQSFSLLLFQRKKERKKEKEKNEEKQTNKGSKRKRGRERILKDISLIDSFCSLLESKATVDKCVSYT